MTDPLPDPEAMTPAELVAEIVKLRGDRIRLKRQVRGLTAGNAWLEKAADMFGDTVMRSGGIVDAIHQARRRYLPDRLHDAPLCDVERCLYRQGMAAFVLLLVYELVTPAIVRQLDAEARQREGDVEAEERARKAPELVYHTAAAWPGNQPRARSAS